ncbi:2-amino-4-hydroxy-6-hydroxymethyldihydropteridine diphosphokinase [Endomicrobium proavitum]|nr:2-amino-4-hydroxy-6-hydroxymethyldihydropteridine diphosphokinase [Endomicrobium proavitum]
MKHKIFLGLGSNIGDRAENIISALSILQSSGFVNIQKISSFYETSAVGPKQRKFYNVVVQAQTNLTPQNLLTLVKQTEVILGRKPSGKWLPRVIDIDILFYGRSVINSQLSILNSQLPLIVPHKEIEHRLFVLIPLAEIAPNFVHPVLNRKINNILKINSLTLLNQKVRITA